MGHSKNRGRRRLTLPLQLRAKMICLAMFVGGFMALEHIVLTGDYDWNSGAAVRTNARPLNLYPARIRA